jgi:hypothetical protein
MTLPAPGQVGDDHGMPPVDRGARPGVAAPVPQRVGHLHLVLPRRTQLLATLLLAGAALLVPWTVFLGETLPPRYPAGHWDVLWTGFDVALTGVLAYAAWAAWFRRQVVASTIIVAGTLLLCDAWFDTVTSIGHRDQWLTLVTGVGVELPAAVLCFWLYRRIALNTLAALYRALGEGPPPRRLREARIPL